MDKTPPLLRLDRTTHSVIKQLPHHVSSYSIIKLRFP